MAEDKFQGQGQSLNSIGKRFRPITPDDDLDLEEIPKYLLVGETAGTIVCIDQDGNTSTAYGGEGQLVALRPTRILESSTASEIIGVFSED